MRLFFIALFCAGLGVTAAHATDLTTTATQAVKDAVQDQVKEQAKQAIQDEVKQTATQAIKDNAKDYAKDAVGNYLGIKPVTSTAKETGKQQLGMEPSSSGKSLSESSSSDSSSDLAAINAKMHHAMNIKLTGNPDRDFVASMIPHHQGAVDMAKYVLENGDDPAVRKLAQGIIKSQQKEIAQMQDWLKKFDAKKKLN